MAIITEEEAFRDMFKHSGLPMTAQEYLLAGTGEGHFQVMQLPELFMRKLAQNLVGRVNRRGLGFKYYCGIVASPESTAAVGLQNDVFCVGVYQGLITSILEVVFWLFRSSKFMPNLGAASSMKGTVGDTFTPVGKNWMLRTAQGLSPSLEDSFFRIGCDIRERAAMQLIVEIVAFIMHHEYQHIMRGHVGYFNTLGISSISEPPDFENGADKKKNAISQVFEYEADSSACDSLVNGKTLLQPAMDNDLYVKIGNRLKSFAPFVALYIFTLKLATSPPATTHPDPFHRMNALLQRMRPGAHLSSLFTSSAPDELKGDLVGMANALVRPEILGIYNIMTYQLWRLEYEEACEVAGPHLASLSDHAFHGVARNPRTKIGRNDPCPCESGKKFKVCCLNRTRR